jgi:hypothetical protein
MTMSIAERIARLREIHNTTFMMWTPEHAAQLTILEEAQAEIDQVRSQLAIQYGHHPGGDLAKAADAKITELTAERDAARTSNAIETNQHFAWMELANERQREIERLTAENRRLDESVKRLRDIRSQEARRALEGK